MASTGKRAAKVKKVTEVRVCGKVARILACIEDDLARDCIVHAILSKVIEKELPGQLEDCAADDEEIAKVLNSLGLDVKNSDSSGESIKEGEKVSIWSLLLRKLYKPALHDVMLALPKTGQSKR